MLTLQPLFFFCLKNIFRCSIMIGPAIPQALLSKRQNQDEIDIALSDDEQDQAEPQQAVGPQIPPHLLQEEKRESNSTHDESIGPQIPPHLLQQKKAVLLQDQDEEQVAGPQIPHHLLEQKRSATANSDEIAISDTEQEEQAAGPQIPRHILDKKRAASTLEKHSDDKEEEEHPDVFAPALPPDLLEQRQKQQSPPQQEQHAGGRRRRPVGPSFPPAGPMPSTDQDDFVVGPALPKNYNPEEEAKYSAIQAIEERARSTKEAMEQVK